MSKDIFTERGITPPWDGGRVAQAQGFARYEGADWRERRKALASLPGAWLFGMEDAPLVEDHGSGRVYPSLGRRAWQTWLRTALSVDGWALPRFSPLPEELDRPATQIRPDVPVQGRWKAAHHHAWLRKDVRGREGASPRTRHAAKLCDLAPPGHGQAIQHPAGDFLPTGHLHPLTGEGVVPLGGRHRHWTQAKYLYTPGSTAKWLGTSPLSLEARFELDDLFFVVLEGTLKMCAVTEAGFPCIDAGSVTLWGSSFVSGDVELDEFGDPYLVGDVMSELTEFAKLYLEGRRVAVVCDSDWHSNPLVLEQTQKVTAVLKDSGAVAVSCAPPEGESLAWSHPYTGVEMRAKRGVDDWLGEHQPGERHDALLELVYHEQASDAELTVDHPALEGMRLDGRKTVVELLLELGRNASPTTRIAPYAERRLMTKLERHKEPLQRARRAAVERGLAEDLIEAERVADGAGNYSMLAPLIRVVPEAMPRYRTGTLREWLGHPVELTQPL